jgi:KaiC/GvpD/RAD55 family RecA-like ATPase
LETEFRNDLGLVFLIAESTPRQSDETPLEQYIADYVFRLAYKETPGGRRIRTWDIVKSHGTNLAAGEHTWELFTRATADGVFFDKQLSAYVRNYLGRTADDAGPSPWPATIVIYPQWSIYISKPADSTAEAESLSEDTAASPIWSGTPGLDEMLLGETEYWIRADKWSQTAQGSTWCRGRCEGETTLLLGASETTKTWISIQFLAGYLHSDR